VRAPGERIVYSNSGFALLGHMAARLNETRFEDLVRSQVLEPLAMHDTSFPLDPRGPGIATPYGHAVKGGAGRTPCTMLQNYTGPAGALLTTANDLARFGRMVLRGGELDGTRVVSGDLLAEATRQAVENHPDLNAGWGPGFETRAQRGRRVAGHSGGLTGVATRIELFPDDGIGVVVLTNGGDPAFVARVTAQLCDGLLGLDPELAPGAPRGIDVGSEDAWRAITTRAVGSYRLVDTFPPGPITMLAGLIAKPKVSHVADCVLAVEGVPGGVMLLYPDGPAGRYRIAGPMLCGDRAVLEAKADGMHFWASIIHMQR
jgi:CubicO group peptidase (beta-lactamase class C family)